MAVQRERPYCRFNFLVDIGDGSTEGASAGFQEVGPIEAEIAVTEYRTGNAKENNVVKITGLSKYQCRAQARPDRRPQPLPVVQRGAKRRPGGAARRHHPTAERGPHGDRADLEAAARADRQVHQRPVQRPVQRCRPRRDRPCLRAPRARVRRRRPRRAARPLELRRRLGRRLGPLTQAFAEVIFPPFVLDGGAARRPRRTTTSGDAAAADGSHLVLRRGATGALDLYEWWDRARRGQAPRRRTVTVRLLGADGQAPSS